MDEGGIEPTALIVLYFNGFLQIVCTKKYVRSKSLSVEPKMPTNIFCSTKE